MPETPKFFLHEAEADIGPVKSDDNSQRIAFVDERGHSCAVVSAPGACLRLVCANDTLWLTRAQAHRLSNTLRHWARAGNLRHD